MTNDNEEVLGQLMAAAVSLHELFNTLVAAGFTEEQALTLTGQLMAKAAAEGG